MGKATAGLSNRSGLTDSGAIPFAILLLLVASFPWDDALGYPTRQVSVGKLLGAALVIAYLASRPHRRWVPVPRVFWVLMAFLAVLVVSLLRSGQVADGAVQCMRYALFAVFYFLVIQLLTDRARLLLLIEVFVVSSTAAAIVGSFRFFASMAGRASGPIGEANDFGYVLATAVPLAFYLAWRHREHRVLWLAASVVLFVTIALTFSRGAVVGLAVAALWAALHSKTIAKGLVGGVVVTAAIGGALLAIDSQWVSERVNAKMAVADENWASRQALWRGAVDMFKEEPLLGIGTGLFPHRATDFVRGEPWGIVEPVAHNAYLEVLAEDGAVGLTLFIVFIAGSWIILVRARRAARNADDTHAGWLALAVQGSALVAVVSAASLSVQIAAPIWLTAAMAVPLAASVGDNRRSLDDDR
ncbi:O-antigen ligase [Mycobacterium sp. 3519A]|uniref:O-antigen ligase family protein n=1 Tax=Mycobacterium sp. 3519A TaxID=2057184 RepID=UPI000C7A615F|nr:O-antigen ligase family protein [Mycobacterium sp. 3519A]